jgi:Fe-S cluster assembly iron-binding protein IscA
MHPLDRIKARTERDKKTVTLSESAIEHLKSFRQEMDSIPAEEEQKQLLYRIAMPNMRFMLGFEDQHEVTDEDTEVFADEELKVVCDEEVFDFLRGVTVDYELHGLSEKITFKDESFKKAHCCGELHPSVTKQF